jgi:hypothetical protein
MGHRVEISKFEIKNPLTSDLRLPSSVLCPLIAVSPDLSRVYPELVEGPVSQRKH